MKVLIGFTPSSLFIALRSFFFFFFTRFALRSSLIGATTQPAGGVMSGGCVAVSFSSSPLAAEVEVRLVCIPP